MRLKTPTLALRKLVLCGAMALAVTEVSAQERATTNPIISYQGILNRIEGGSAEGLHEITVRIYEGAAISREIWKATYSTTVSNGYFQLMLGSGDVPLPDLSKLSTELWLSMQVNGGEELPATRLTASPMALTVPDGAITAKKIDADYVSGVTVNGKTITGKGEPLNLIAGEGLKLQYDEASKSLIIKSEAVMPSLGSAGKDNTNLLIPISVPLGGTGRSSLTNNAILIGNGSDDIETQTLTSGQLLIGSTGNAPQAATLTGTANQITVTNGAGSITLSTPQNIATTSSPSFANLTLSGKATSSATTSGDASGTLTTKGYVDNLVSVSSASIAAEAAARMAADATLQANINVEATARTAGDATLQTNINSEASTRSAADITLQNNITAEAAARSAADAALQSNIDNEASIRAAADVSLQNNINAEAAARTTADAMLQSNIDAEAATRTAGDILLQSNIDAEAAARVAGDATLQSNIDNEASIRAGADVSLQNNIDAEVAARTAADVMLQNNIDAEAATRVAGDITLQNNIDAEVVARTAADIALQNNIDAEAITRAAADATLQNNINGEASTRAAADITLQNNINAEAAMRATADNALQTQINGKANDADVVHITGTETVTGQKTFTSQLGVSRDVTSLPGGTYYGIQQSTTTSPTNTKNIFGISSSASGSQSMNIAVEGLAFMNNTAFGMGGRFRAQSFSSSGEARAGDFEARDGATNIGVHAVAAGSTGTNFGGLFQASPVSGAGSGNGTAVRGVAFNKTNNVGISGLAFSGSGNNGHVGGDFVAQGSGGSSSAIAGRFSATGGGFNVGVQVTNGGMDITGNSKITGQLDMANNRIVNLGTPTAATDAATKQYVDNSLSGFALNSDVVHLSGFEVISGQKFFLNEIAAIRNVMGQPSGTYAGINQTLVANTDNNIQITGIIANASGSDEQNVGIRASASHENNGFSTAGIFQATKFGPATGSTLGASFAAFGGESNTGVRSFASGQNNDNIGGEFYGGPNSGTSSATSIGGKFGGFSSTNSIGIQANANSNIPGSLIGAQVSAFNTGGVGTVIGGQFSATGGATNIGVQVQSGGIQVQNGGIQVQNSGVQVIGNSSINGQLNMNGSQIVNLGTPTSPSDAATKQYVDNAMSGDFVDLTSNQTIDGFKSFQKPMRIETSAFVDYPFAVYNTNYDVYARFRSNSPLNEIILTGSGLFNYDPDPDHFFHIYVDQRLLKLNESGNIQLSSQQQKIFVSSETDNTDAIYFQRTHVTSDRSDLSLYIGDDYGVSGGDDRFIVRTVNGPTDLFSVSSETGIVKTKGDVYLEDIGSGVIVKSPNGQCWRITVDNAGAFVSTNIGCP